MVHHAAGEPLGRFLTIADTAEVLAVDVETVHELVISGELPAIRIGDRGPWRVERSQLEVFIEMRYESTRREVAWNEGEFANVIEFAGVRPGGLRPVD
ncbi:helix-turn-helix domain-containing protein [Agromyces binzhouensis]|uniref:helix-turn-helix domain-containing protein n=1 Tax=Agromyces binzhouensis TaxID=1817495 RepID=UPI00362F7243